MSAFSYFCATWRWRVRAVKLTSLVAAGILAASAVAAQDGQPRIGAYPDPPLSRVPADRPSPPLRESPALERERRELCASDPGACVGGRPTRQDLLTRSHDEHIERIRRGEQFQEEQMRRQHEQQQHQQPK